MDLKEKLANHLADETISFLKREAIEMKMESNPRRGIRGCLVDLLKLIGFVVDEELEDIIFNEDFHTTAMCALRKRLKNKFERSFEDENI